jgi:hypothetical protein
MTGKIEQTTVVHPNVYGYKLTLGDRQAIVARTDSCCGHWTVFHYQGKRQWCIGFSKPDTDRTTAMREAAKRKLQRQIREHQCHNHG